MQINVTGQHVDITSSLKDYASEKVGKLEKHFDHVTTTHVVLRVEKNRQLAEATVNATGATIHANAEGEDMYAAIDIDRKSTRLNSSHTDISRMPSSA